MKIFLIIITTAVIVALVTMVSIIGAGFYKYDQTPKNIGVACTMEAKLCPDGSAVGRSGPNCEFAPCPGQ